MSFTTLSHSVNSSGRMGLYVDSASCACNGCAEYRGHALDIPLMDAADAHLFVAPTALLTRSLGTGLQRAPANQIWDGSGWVHTDSETGRALMGLPAEPAPAPAPLPSSSRASFVTVARGPSVVPPAPLAVEAEAEAAMASLRSLRATLQIRQDHVYEGAEESHSDMAIADAEFEDLDRKIMAIEQCMLSFGAIFRTR